MNRHSAQIPRPTAPSALSATASCTERLKVLADATRLEVVRRLSDGPCHVGALSEAAGIEQSLMSHHLKVLRDVGMVEAVRDGKSVLYRLPAGTVSRSANVIKLGCCDIAFHD